jgi:DNA repair protein RecN (Recombination protein N)
MLEHLSVKDFVIVDGLEVEFQPGMTVLTGETGAGKSILIDALGLALGERADAGVIREGCALAEVTAGFDLSRATAARQWLEEHELSAGQECLLRRTVSAEGRSKGYINGRVVPIQLLRELGELLVDIHGQHEHQSLLQSAVQRELVDAFAGQQALAAQVSDLYQRWRAGAVELARLREAAQERDSRRELLRYQVQELEGLALAEGELEALRAEQLRLANAGNLLQAGQRALGAIYEDDQESAHSRLSTGLAELDGLLRLDTDLAPLRNLLENARIEVKEAAAELRRYLGAVELDPDRLREVEQRLDLIYNLARKHRVVAEDLGAHCEHLAAELGALESEETRLAEIDAELAGTSAAYRSQAQALSRFRQQAAQSLAEEVSTHMQDLGMPGGRFQVSLEPLAEEAFAAGGLERVSFLVSANPGQAPQPLAKVASGGELSRVSLAIQVVVGGQGGKVPTLIFDEVDSGIGGAVAEVVGRTLRELTDTRQVFAVTHLPQVAAQGHHHLQVRKELAGASVRTSLSELGREDRVREIGRMLGGLEISEHTLAHAREMLGNAQPAT